MPEKNEPEKRVVFTRHARERMEQRGISEADVKAALADRSAIQLPYSGGGSRIRSRAGSVPLQVGIQEHEDRIIIITVMRTDT